MEQKTQKINSQMSFSQIIGDIIFIMMKAPYYKHLFLNDLEWLVLPAVKLRQMRIFRDENMPLGYISWANISEEVENRLLEGIYRIKPNDWNSGDRVWIIDNINLTGRNIQFLKSLQENVFKDKEAKMVKPKKDGKGFDGILLKDFIKNFETENEKNKEND
jgi:cytolysin-activating lysine-acyltransferase